MTTHIGAKKGEIAETVLLPGDPLRAKFIAEQYLEDARLYNEIRGMLGYTGFYKGKKVSVQGSGMGMPSISIYAHELIQTFGIRQLIRVGSCGAYQPDIILNDLILAMGASTNSSMNRRTFQGMDFAPLADFDLLQQAWQIAQQRKFNLHIGNVLSSDIFYSEQDDRELWAKHNVLAVEMETAALYTMAARFNVQALSILTVSDSLVTGEQLTALERERSFAQMAVLALDLVATKRESMNG